MAKKVQTKPRTRKKPSGPIDLNAFMKRLKNRADPARLAKALSMLKADRFKLFVQIEPDSLVGVVKSQTDPNLVYSCRLTAAGGFACCTQNLNVCGGLRGALCKYLLVLIVGLTKAGELDPTQVDKWVESSRSQKPVLDKDVMSATFLRYKGAEAGEVDWRPTETIPEDFYAGQPAGGSPGGGDPGRRQETRGRRVLCLRVSPADPCTGARVACRQPAAVVMCVPHCKFTSNHCNFAMLLQWFAMLCNLPTRCPTCPGRPNPAVALRFGSRGILPPPLSIALQTRKTRPVP